MSSVITPRSKCSWVWKHFKKLSIDTAQCQICSKTIERSDGSTSGMKNHLKVHDIFDDGQKHLEIESFENDLLLKAVEEGKETRKY